MSDKTRVTIGDEYEILDVLGHGGMARVFKARHKYLDRLVALKMLPPHFLTDDEARARFEREARSGAQLEHPHIVTTYDFGIYEDQPYLAVAFIEGASLSQYILRKGRLRPDEAAHLIAPIAEALAYAHRKGVIHRDIKSSNIMIRAEDERPILIDFGIAQASSSQRLTQRGSMLGTPAYMSPEQASAYDIDFRSDLYSLGVVLYECLSGNVPFQSTNTAVLLTNIKHEPHRPVQTQAPDVPAWLSAIVDRCLEKKPEDRYPDGDALAEALRAGPDGATAVPDEAYTQDETVMLVPQDETPSAPTSPGAPRHTSLLWGIGLAAAILVLGGAGYFLGAFDGLFGENAELVQADTLETTSDTSGMSGTVTADTLVRDNTTAATDQGDAQHDAQNDDARRRTRSSTATDAKTSSDQRADRQAENALADLMGRARTAYQAGRYEEALPLLEDAAHRGSGDARFYLGTMYEHGRGVRQSDVEAVRWYRAAAEQGSAEAQFALSNFYRDGRTVEKDLDEAAAWCRRAAEQGLADAQFTLGRLYFRGEGVPRSDEEAAAWYRKAAVQGHEQARGALERLTGEHQD